MKSLQHRCVAAVLQGAGSNKHTVAWGADYARTAQAIGAHQLSRKTIVCSLGAVQYARQSIMAGPCNRWCVCSSMQTIAAASYQCIDQHIQTQRATYAFAQHCALGASYQLAMHLGAAAQAASRRWLHGRRMCSTAQPGQAAEQAHCARAGH